MDDRSRKNSKKSSRSGALEKSSPPDKPDGDEEKKQFTPVIFRDWCKACGICMAFCPKKVIGKDEAGFPCIFRPDDCIGCRFCELHCPDFAITILEKKPETQESTS